MKENIDEQAYLRSFVPAEAEDNIKFVEDSAYLVERIAEVLPKEVVWGNFAEKGLTIRGVKTIPFPYCRVDSRLASCKLHIDLIEGNRLLDEQSVKESYEEASRLAMQVLVWVEVGFQGWENFVDSPASVNWTAIEFADDEEGRKKHMMTEGRKLYDEALRRFAKLRKEQGITDDCFSQYGLEYLLPEIEEN